ncbi:hypothetical protein PS723_06478 [Pseudomonas fluorescens]|uniref:Uncharacterized protein n=2 Tax=Pseudomonas fluorescens TaxID=294 RepID=A0A5E7G7D8_PSEFL|nr:hypothetical protein PS723_06478 [Pseudomonas fluorescens]
MCFAAPVRMGKFHGPAGAMMRREIGYWDREGRELFYYLEFKAETAEFFITCEHKPRDGDASVRSVPLSEARGERYYGDALLIIKEELFKDYRI